MTYDFDKIIERRNTGNVKWDRFKGRDIIPMWVADMDFQSPPEVMAAMHRYVDHGVFGYPLPTDEQVATVCNFLKTKYGWKIKSSWLVWLPGLVPALNLACRTYCEPGEAVIMTTPIYPPFLMAPKFSKREMITVPLDFAEGCWRVNLERLKEAVSPETRLLLLCNPYNPVGRVLPADEVRAIADFCREREIVLCSDEIHCELILDDLTHTPTAMLGPDIADITVTLMAPSKTFNLPGLCLAYAVISNGRLRQKFKAEMRGITPEINSIGVVACQAAYEHGEPWRLALLDYLRKNRNFVQEFVNQELPGISVQHVEATYLAFLDVRNTGLEDPNAFFEAAGVGLSDGRLFGTDGFQRLNFGCPRATLEEGLRRMKNALDG